jgi:hypothetical protein
VANEELPLDLLAIDAASVRELKGVTATSRLASIGWCLEPGSNRYGR